jgi:cell division septation protein DedD
MIKYNEKGVKENQASEVVSIEKEVTPVSPEPEPISKSSVLKQQNSISNTFSGAYLIGCYAVSEEKKAKQLVSVLRSKNFEAGYFFIPDYEPSGSRMYRVYIGPFLSRDLALQELSNTKQYIKEAYIVNMKQLPSLQSSGETFDTVHIRNE